MTFTRCSCGHGQFEVFLASPAASLKGDSRSLGRGPIRVDCPKCGRSFAIEEPSTKSRRGSSSSSMVEQTGEGDAVRRIDLSRLPEVRLDKLLQDVEKSAILFALREAGGNRSDAARVMGISRSRLYRRLEALKIPTNREMVMQSIAAS